MDDVWLYKGIGATGFNIQYIQLVLRDSDRLDCSVRVGHMSLSLVALLMYVCCACTYCT